MELDGWLANTHIFCNDIVILYYRHSEKYDLLYKLLTKGFEVDVDPSGIWFDNFVWVVERLDVEATDAFLLSRPVYRNTEWDSYNYIITSKHSSYWSLMQAFQQFLV